MWTKCILTFALLVGYVFCYPEGRVVNGTDSSILKYPFIVSIRNSRNSHSCGGSIITPRWILTAAHCTVGADPNRISIQYAVTKINATGPNVAEVKRIIIHENYSPAKSYANDISLLELKGQLIYNYKTLGPVTLPTQNFEIPQTSTGTSGVLIGWGLEKTYGTIQQNLQEVELKIYSDEECNSRHNGRTTADHICGGVDGGWKGQCSGDSGGPLVYQGSVQLGIVSWSEKPCTIPPYPGVYTKVSHYVDWILQRIR